MPSARSSRLGSGLALRGACVVAAALAFAACSSDDTTSGDPGTADGAMADTLDPGDSLGGADTTADVAADTGSDTGDTGMITPEVPPAPTDRLALVDPFVGTGAEGFNVGAMAPGPTTPFGLVTLSPDTADDSGSGGVFHAAGYRYQDPWLVGFSHLHLVGTGVADYGNLLVMPALGEPSELTTWQEYRVPLDHSKESAAPGYYRIEMDGGITAELTATPRAGVHRYTWPATDSARLVVDVTRTLSEGYAESSDFTVDPATGIVTGSVHVVGDFTRRFGGFEIFFEMRPDRVPTSVGVWDDAGFHPGQTSGSGVHAGLIYTFDTTADATVELSVGISLVDLPGAQANLAQEVGTADFDAVRSGAEAVWESVLALVDVHGGTETRQKIFYTMLYRVFMMPHVLTDTDGRYRGLDKEVHTADGFTYYSDLSLWDTYRTFHPLVGLLTPDWQRDFLHSLVQMAEDGGSLPRWPLAIGYTGSMLGNSAGIVFGDAVAAGAPDFPVEAAYAAARKISMGDVPEGRPGLSGLGPYMENGWVAHDQEGGSVSRTLEYSTADACLAVMADQLGNLEDAAMFRSRSLNYQFNYDGAFFAPRNADGSWAEYSPVALQTPFVEGTAWHYLFMVPHDVPGLVELLGGAETFVERLEEFMVESQKTFVKILPNSWYYHGNEPDILAAFLFAHAGRADLSRHWTEWIADTAYSLDPGGLAGNDDGGTLSSWYVFAASGFYPLSCTGRYTLTTPLFDRVVWHLPGGDLTVDRAADATGDMLIDGAVWTEPDVPYATLAAGAHIVLPAAP